jgi:hypothetical protein
MWILLLIAVHVNDPKDIPAKVQLTFETREDCQRAESTLEYWVKFKQFKVETSCLKKK